jgi:hypothetical protein
LKPTDLLAIDGVFLAVRCTTCGAVYDARSHDFVAFGGPTTLGLDQPVVPWTKPGPGKRGAVKVVCRTPECLGGLVRTVLGCAEGQAPDPKALWQQALGIWLGELGLEATPRAEREAAPETSSGARGRRG